MPQVRIRERVPEDVPVLAKILLAQQAETRYPFRDPLPIPVEDFMHAHDAARAWTAELDGDPIGHVARMDSPRVVPAADVLTEVCARAHGCDPNELAWVSTLFVAPEARGLGIARALMDTVVQDILDQGLHPCLEVLPVHAGALSLYVSTGWRTVHRVRPDWLREAAGEEGPDVQVMVLTGQG